MKAVQALAVLANEQGEALPDLLVNLECFTLKAGRWVLLAQGSTGPRGELRLQADLALPADAPAPQLRLALGDAPADWVLAEGGHLAYAPRKGLLSIDFGTVQVLSEPGALQTSGAKSARTRGATPAPVIAARPALAGRPVVSAGTAGMVMAAGTVQAPAVAAAPLETPVMLNLRTELDTTRLNLVRVQTERTELQNQVQALQADRLQLAAQHQGTQAELVKVQGERVNLQNQVQTLQLEKGSLAEQARVAQADLRQLQVAHSGLQNQVKLLQDDKASLGAQLEALKQRPVLGNVVRLQNLTQDLQTQFGNARVNVAAASAGMQLGDVRIKLRGKLGPDGQFQLPSAEQLLKPDASNVLDEVDFGLQAPATGNADLNVPVPQLSRLTETAARQVLQSLGLRLDSATGACELGFVSGQAMRQAPLAGERAARGAAVLVVFAQ